MLTSVTKGLPKINHEKPAATLHERQDMHTVMEKFDITQSWYLPVLNRKVYMNEKALL